MKSYQMTYRILSEIDFKNLWLLLPILLLFFFGVQAVVGFFLFQDWIATKLLLIIILGLIIYLTSSFFLNKCLKEDFLFAKKTSQISWLLSDSSIIIISAVYFLLIIYVVFSAKNIALIEALNGSPADVIAFAREELFKNRDGWESGLIYVNTIFTSAIMPYLLSICYLQRMAYRHFLLFFLLISQLFSLEKGLSIKFLLPLIGLAFTSYLPRRMGYFFILIFICLISMTTLLSKMGTSDIAIKKIQISENGVRNRLHPFGEGNQLLYLLNRTLWIPYVTAYDSLDYHDKILKNKYLLGSSSKILSLLQGIDQYPLEQEVFKFQQGERGPPTASANTNFLVDGFINFGFFGVVFLSFFVAFLTQLIQKFGNPASKACFLFFCILFNFGGFFGTFFSNGLIFLFVFALFSKSKTH